MQRAQNKIANLQSELATFKEEGVAQETGKWFNFWWSKFDTIILLPSLFPYKPLHFITYILFLGNGVIMQTAPSIHPPSHSMSSLSPIPPHSGSIITASNGEHLAKINTQLIQVSLSFQMENGNNFFLFPPLI